MGYLVAGLIVLLVGVGVVSETIFESSTQTGRFSSFSPPLFIEVASATEFKTTDYVEYKNSDDITFYKSYDVSAKAESGKVEDNNWHTVVEINDWWDEVWMKFTGVNSLSGFFDFVITDIWFEPDQDEGVEAKAVAVYHTDNPDLTHPEWWEIDLCSTGKVTEEKPGGYECTFEDVAFRKKMYGAYDYVTYSLDRIEVRVRGFNFGGEWFDWDGVEFNIWIRAWPSEPERIGKFEFDISDEIYDNFVSGEIHVKGLSMQRLDDSYKEDGVAMKLNGYEIVKSSDYHDLLGTHTVSKDKIKKGRNTIEFVSDGSFNILFEISAGRLTVKIEYISDTNPPDDWKDFTPSGWIRDQTPDCSIKVKDTKSGLDVSTAEYRYSTNGGTSWSGWKSASCTGSDGTTSYQTITAKNVPFNQDSKDKNKIQFRIKDMAGNTGMSPIYTVKIDATKPPAPAPDDGVEGWSNDNTPTFSWNKPSDTSGIAGYYWKVDSGSEKWTTSTSVTLPAQPDGEHTFYVRAKDNAGNIGDYGSHKFKIDTTPPSSEVKELPKVQTSRTFTVSWEGSDALSGIRWYDVQYKKDDGSWTDWLAHTTLTSEQFTGACGHTYYFRCRAEDNAGNWEDYGEADTYTYINCPPNKPCLLYTSPSPRDGLLSRMPSSA